MFSLGPMEMAIVGIVAVLLFGKKLPEVMRSLGKSYTEFRKGLAEMQSSVHYSDYTSSSSSSYSTSRSQDFDDYDEPTAPRFEPPPPSNESSPPNGNSENPTDGSEQSVA